MITKDNLLVNINLTQANTSRTISVKLTKTATMCNSFSCDGGEASALAIVSQLKRSLMQDIYSDVVRDLIELRDMTGAPQNEIRRAIIDKLDKYTGVIDE